jgi:hypothetical protein
MRVYVCRWVSAKEEEEKKKKKRERERKKEVEKIGLKFPLGEPP